MEKTTTSDNRIKEDNAIVDLVYRWGSPASEILFDYQHSYFTAPNIDGVIGYRIESNCAITFGDPICSFDKRPYLAQSFHRFCKDKGLNVIHMVASKQFADWAHGDCCSIKIEVGEELIYDSQCDPRDGPKGSKVRNMISHAKNLGLTVHEYLVHNDQFEREMLQVGMNWVHARKGPYIHLSALNFFDYRTGRRWFYIKDQERLTGVAMLIRRDANQSWMLKFLTTIPKVPRGTSELLMASILDILRKENCRLLTYALVPANSLGEVKGLSKFSAFLAHSVFTATKLIFRFEQHKTYWQKFHPKREPFYLLLAKPSIGLNEIRALTKSIQFH